MHINSRAIQILTGMSILLIGACVLGGCTKSRPPFVIDVIPPQGESVYLGELYKGSITWVTLDISELLTPGESMNIEELRKRTVFMIDDATMNINIIQNTRSRLKIVGDYDIPPGSHTATLHFQKSSGQLLTYSWTFTVLDSDQVPGLPVPFQFVRPLPDSTISLFEYRNKELIPPVYRGYLNEYTDSVCVGVFSSDVAEPYLESNGVDIAHRYDLVTVDGVPPKAPKPAEYNPMARLYSDGTIYQYPYNNTCWPFSIFPGRHEATAQAILTDSTVITSTWQFTITRF